MVQEVHSHTLPCCPVLVNFSANCSSVARKTADYFSANMGNLFAIIVAWGGIILCTGFLFGFQAKAVPLAIGLGGGCALGPPMTGILLANRTAKGRAEGTNSVMGLVKKGLAPLRGGFTIAILQALALYVAIAVIYAFPFIFGAVAGVLMTNYLADQIAAYRKGQVDQSVEERLNALERNVTRGV